jgi:parallel beta-helix repeat protein
MNKNLFRKGFVLYIMTLFIGSCILSTTGAVIEKNDYFSEIFINSNEMTFYVGGSGPGNYTKIQDAIDNTSDGDKVIVYGESSPYYENLIINKSIFLIGEHPTITLIDGNYKQCTIIVNVGNVVITGFHIIHGNLSGLKLLNSEGSYIYYNIFELNNRYGISLIESNNNIIEINTIVNNENGIKISSNSKNNVINGNRIDNNYNGVFVESSIENLITTNEIINNECGIKLYSKSRNNRIELNTISHNNLGIFLGGTIYPTFGFNILIDGSTHNKITKNNFIENSQDAFFQNSRRNLWRSNYWNESRLLPKLINGELFICRLQGIPPEAIEHHIPWIPRIDWRPALKPF